MELSDPLKIEDVDFRIQSINNGGYATILAYKDARVDMQRLDDVYGAGFWQRRHEVIDGNLYCSVGVWNDSLAQWIWVQDVGTESYTDKEKGQASDSFKRACFNLGIGRELYDYPVISTKLNNSEWRQTEYNGKKKNQSTWDLNLRQWEWYSEFAARKITFLACRDTHNKVRFQWGKRIDND